MPTRNRLLLPVIASLLWAGAGCRMAADPSCSVQQELCDDHCLRCLYCPQCTTDCFSDEPWYCRPTLWMPRCRPIRAGSERIRPLPSADNVFALPRASAAD